MLFDVDIFNVVLDSQQKLPDKFGLIREDKIYAAKRILRNMCWFSCDLLDTI